MGILDELAVRLAPVKARLAALARLGDVGRWLDVGCGVGHDVAAVGIGVDTSVALLSEGRSRWPAARFIAGAAERLPFRSSSFDAAKIERVLQHVTEPTAVLREVGRVLRPGGRVAIFEPDWETVGNTSTINGQVGRELDDRLIESGFTVELFEPETVPWREHPELHLTRYYAVGVRA